MELNISKPVKILALVGVLAALAMFVGLRFMAGSTAEASAADVSAHASKLRAAMAQKRAKAGVNVVANKAAAPNKVAPRRVAKKAKPIAAKPAPRVAVNKDLPPTVAQALRRHEVVVVTLFSPKGTIDEIALGEAEAGAAMAGVGFLALNVSDQRQAKPLAEKYGVLRNPSVFVFVRPGEAKWTATGFADRDTVAQAAANAKPVPRTARALAVSSTWGASANAICLDAREGAEAIGPNATVEDLKAWLPGALAREQHALRRLRALALPKQAHDRRRVQEFLASVAAVAAFDQAMALSVERNQIAKLERQSARWAAEVQRASTLAASVGAPDCVYEG